MALRPQSDQEIQIVAGIHQLVKSVYRASKRKGDKMNSKLKCEYSGSRLKGQHFVKLALRAG